MTFYEVKYPKDQKYFYNNRGKPSLMGGFIIQYAGKPDTRLITLKKPDGKGTSATFELPADFKTLTGIIQMLDEMRQEVATPEDWIWLQDTTKSGSAMHVHPSVEEQTEKLMQVYRPKVEDHKDFPRAMAGIEPGTKEYKVGKLLFQMTHHDAGEPVIIEEEKEPTPKIGSADYPTEEKSDE